MPREKNSDARLSCKLIITAHRDVSGRHLNNMVYCFVTVIAKNKLCNYGTNVTVTQQAIEIHYIFFPMEATAAEARLSSDTKAAKYNNSNNTSTEWNGTWQMHTYRRNVRVPQNVGRFLNLGVLTQVAARLQVFLPLHLNCDRVEVVGGETSLCHFSQDWLSVHWVICRGRTSMETPHGYEWSELAIHWRKKVFFSLLWRLTW